jgi:hypothetical protein
MTEPTQDTEAASPAPAPAAEAPKTTAQKTEKPTGLPLGQIAVGGLGATVLGSAALASVVGPAGWLAAPVAATAGGAAYIAHRRRKKKGGTKGVRTEKTTVTRGSTGTARMGGLGGRMPGLGSGRTAGKTSVSRAGGVGAAGAGRRSGAGPAGGSSRGSLPRGGSLRGSSRPGSPGSGSRGSVPRSSSPRGGLFRRSAGDTTTAKRKNPPNSGTGGRTTGGSVSKSRWGGARPATHKPGLRGRISSGAARARDWADDRTGRRASGAWKAAADQSSFKARRRAAAAAARKSGSTRIGASILGAIAALFGPRKKPTRPKPAEETPAGRYARDGYTLGPEVPGHPGSYYADPRDRRPGYVDRRGLGPDHPGYTTGDYDANVDPRSWEERKAAHTTGGTTMAGLPAASIAADMTATMSRYSPADAYQIVPDSRQWVDVSTQVAMAVKAYADRLEAERFPINQAINDKLREYATAIAQTRQIAEEIEPLMRRAHEDDLARRESPRGDESKWNI